MQTHLRKTLEKPQEFLLDMNKSSLKREFNLKNMKIIQKKF